MAKIYLDENKSIDGMEMKGWPRIINDELYLINRHSGIFSHFNIQNLDCIRLIDEIDTKGHPEDIILYNDRLWFLCGHRGILLIKNQS